MLNNFVQKIKNLYSTLPSRLQVTKLTNYLTIVVATIFVAWQHGKGVLIQISERVILCAHLAGNPWMENIGCSISHWHSHS